MTHPKKNLALAAGMPSLASTPSFQTNNDAKVPMPLPVHLNGLKKKISLHFEKQTRPKNIRLHIETDSNHSHWVAEEEYLFALIKHLVSNALLFVQEGSIEVRMFSEPSESGATGILEVRDTGQGLPAEWQNQVRRIFESEKPEQAASMNETGPAFLAVRRIADAMGGSPGFTSLPGSGSAFWVEFPLQTVSGRPASPRKESGKSHSRPESVPEILLVDDNDIYLRLAMEILSGAGWHVDTANNGEEAIKLAKSGLYHLILMDIQMPGMDGLTAAGAISNLRLNRHPAILAFTAYCMEEDKARYLEAGMDDFISKAASPENLLRKVSYWTEKTMVKGKRKTQIYEIPRPKKEDSLLQPVMDVKVLHDLRRHLGHDLLMECLDDFANETRNLIINIDSAFSRRDWEKIKSQIHILKGNAGTFGVNRLFAVACEMDNDLKINKLAAFCGQLESLREAAGEFFESLYLLRNSHDW